jgi:hypothetical protein
MKNDRLILNKAGGQFLELSLGGTEFHLMSIWKVVVVLSIEL